MEKSNLKSIGMLFLVGTVILLSACSQFGGGNSQDIDTLENQINQMATQNALLQQQIDNYNEGGAQAPPPNVEDSQSQINMVTPTTASLPDQPVPAGSPIIYDGWSVLVSKNIEIANWNSNYPTPLIYLSITIRNMDINNRVFRYSRSAISLKDDLGNNYPPYSGFDHNDFNCEKEHFSLMNLTIEGEDSVTLKGHPVQCNDVKRFHVFEGPVPLEAKQLILLLTDFGPFTGVEILIDL
jgi:hypothetical protein